jgi:hypothetical protein
MPAGRHSRNNSHKSGRRDWPTSRCVYSSLFVAASGAPNLAYGLSKGTDPISIAVWASVSIETSIIFCLAWPALIRSVEMRRWYAAMVVLIALLLAGSYSVTAALGSAASGRANATISETAATDARTRAQVVYDAARSELATVKPTRTVGELQAMRDGWKRAYRSEPWVLEPELARAKRRAELEQKIERAATDLAKTMPTNQATSDAVALMGYLVVFGITATSDTVARWLVILAVLLVRRWSEPGNRPVVDQIGRRDDALR